jgi:trimeric autotransporter adhesin
MLRSAAHLACALGILTLACGDDDPTGSSGPNYTISLSAEPPGVNLPIGGTATVSLTLARGGGYGGTVSLIATPLPANVSASFAPQTLTGTATRSTLTLSASDAAAVGAYVIPVLASGDSVAAAQAIINTHVQEVPAFTITPVKTTLPMTAGSFASVVIAIGRSGSFTDGVVLSCEGEPAGVTCTFITNPAYGFQSTLTVSANASSVPGTYPITLRGQANPLDDRTTSLTLEISAAAGYTRP